MANFKTILGVLAALAMVNGGAARGEDNAVPLVFGVDLGTSVEELTAALRASGVVCEAGQGAVICPTGLSALANQPGTSTTFWVASGRVSRIYQVGDMAALGLSSYSALTALFKDRQGRIQGLLGDLPVRVTGREPSWMASLDEDSKLGWLRAGMFWCEVVWESGARKLSLTMRGEKGRALLVLGLEPAAQLAPQTSPVSAAQPDPQAKPCDSSEVAAWMMDLFPPATPRARAAAAKALAGCKIERSSGALAAALAHDEDESVRSATVDALSSLGRTQALHDLLGDAGESDRLRAEAARALASRGDVPSPAQRKHLRKGAGAQLAQALKDIATPPPAASAPQQEKKPLASTAAAGAPAPSRDLQAAPPSITYTIAKSEFEAPVPAPAHAPAPTTPPKPSDGAALAITASTIAGGLWGAGLSKLALQDSVGFITLAGSAGAIIGGGTALGLVHFGKRPTPEQALFYTNSTAWGSLAGLMAWAGTGSDNVKLKYGFLVGGELTGMATGVYGARRWQWTAAQVLLSDSLVLAAGIGGMGIDRMAKDTMILYVPGWVGYSTAPAMIAAAVASRYLDVSKNDLQFALVASASTAWTTGLIASGIDGSGLVSGHVGQGGMMLGLSAGYLAAIAASPFIDVTGAQAMMGSGAVLLGNSMGLGTHMLIAPESSQKWTLGAGLGGVGLLAAGAVAAPYLRVGPQAATMGAAGLVYGAGTWGLANLAAGRAADARLSGGLLAFAPAAGIVGALASAKYDPSAADYATVAATSA
ncbi:MAG TPA: HEAT repeat domain-containing protein, partial [Polyangia bacterium]